MSKGSLSTMTFLNETSVMIAVPATKVQDRLGAKREGRKP